MFTGIIQCVGQILAVEKRGTETRLRVQTDQRLRDFVPGESIAINGACLTVETFSTSWFSVYASSETMSLTNLSAQGVGAAVNLERALAMGDRLGGHMVSGHVDCVATVTNIQPAGESRRYSISFDPHFSPQVISKGSVALDGISLTVNHCGNGFLEVNIIPATQKETTVSRWTQGTRINMETDIIGKYVQSLTRPWNAVQDNKEPSKVTMHFLRQHGF